MAAGSNRVRRHSSEPVFQPPGANLGAAIDVSDVKFIAFAPQDRTSGRLVISRFVVMK